MLPVLSLEGSEADDPGSVIEVPPPPLQDPAPLLVIASDFEGLGRGTFAGDGRRGIPPRRRRGALAPAGRRRVSLRVMVVASTATAGVSPGRVTAGDHAIAGNRAVRTIGSNPTGIAWASGSNPTGRKPQFLAAFQPPGSAVRASQRTKSASPPSSAQRKPRRRVAIPFLRASFSTTTPKTSPMRSRRPPMLRTAAVDATSSPPTSATTQTIDPPATASATHPGSRTWGNGYWSLASPLSVV